MEEEDSDRLRDSTEKFVKEEVLTDWKSVGSADSDRWSGSFENGEGSRGRFGVELTVGWREMESMLGLRSGVERGVPEGRKRIGWERFTKAYNETFITRTGGILELQRVDEGFVCVLEFRFR